MGKLALILLVFVSCKITPVVVEKEVLTDTLTIVDTVKVYRNFWRQ